MGRVLKRLKDRVESMELTKGLSKGVLIRIWTGARGVYIAKVEEGETPVIHFTYAAKAESDIPTSPDAV